MPGRFCPSTEVHSLLGDVGLENEDFEGALSDFQEAAEHLEAATLAQEPTIDQVSGRRSLLGSREVAQGWAGTGMHVRNLQYSAPPSVRATEQSPTTQQGIALARQRAEILYKQGMAWQFLDNAAEALSATRAAVEVLRGLETELAGMVRSGRGWGVDSPCRVSNAGCCTGCLGALRH